LPGSQGINKDVLRVLAIKRCPRPALMLPEPAVVFKAGDAPQFSGHPNPFMKCRHSFMPLMLSNRHAPRDLSSVHRNG
jgi:hypothetical protein